MAAPDITLFHAPMTRSIRPRWMLEEMGLAYTLERVSFDRGDVGGEEYRRINPLQKIPAMKDGEVVMLESLAMVQYLASRYGPTPLAVAPEEPDYPRYLEWLFYGEATMSMGVNLVLAHVALLPEAQRNPAILKWAREQVDKQLGCIAERGLDDGREWLAAGRFTAADISVGYMLYLLKLVRQFDGAPEAVQALLGAHQGAPRLDRRQRGLNSGQVTPQEVDRPGVGGLGVLGVIMRAALSGEGMVALGVGMDRHLGMILEAFNDLLLRVRRNELVLARDVQHQGVSDIVGLAEMLVNLDAVIADARLARGPARGQIGEKAAEAVADHARLAVSGVTGGRQRRGDVVNALVGVERAEQLEGPLPVLLGLVGELNAGLNAPEQVRAHREEALRGEVIADPAHHGVDAEDLLDHDDSGAGAGGVG